MVTSPPRCELPYELFELTSSGMTHGILDEIPNKYGLKTLFQLVLGETFLMEWFWPFVGRLQHPRYIARNFGEVAIDFGDDSGGHDGYGGPGTAGPHLTAVSPQPDCLLTVYQCTLLTRRMNGAVQAVFFSTRTFSRLSLKSVPNTT